MKLIGSRALKMEKRLESLVFKEPEEIGFIMLVIAVSLGCATFNLYFLVSFLAIAIVGLIVLKIAPLYQRAHIAGGILLLKMPNDLYDQNETILIENISKVSPKIKLQSLSRDTGLTTLTYDMNGLLEVQQTELMALLGRIDSRIELDVYLNDTRITAF